MPSRLGSEAVFLFTNPLAWSVMITSGMPKRGILSVCDRSVGPSALTPAGVAVSLFVELGNAL